MKIIFLDIDGVLNNKDTFTKLYNGLINIEIDEERLIYLKRIIDETGALIVISSSWRKLLNFDNGIFTSNSIKGEKLLELLNKYEITIFDKTSSNFTRGEEIKEYLETHDNIKSFIILDDELYSLEDFENKELILTRNINSKGLNESYSKIAIQKLNLTK